jgi:DNA polymerase-3 subunit epsilon
MAWPITLEFRRRWYLRRLPPGPLRDYLATPFPDPVTNYRQVEFLAVDLETTGLDSKKDHILSFGYLTLSGDHLDLTSARHRLVHTKQAIPEASAVIHQITDDQAATGAPLEEVLAEFLIALKGKVLLAHHSLIEETFIDLACRRLFGGPLLAPIVDTQAIALRHFQRRQIPFKGGDLRLYALGARYNLPRYGAHNALSDALAAGELFLAQAAHRDAGQGVPLREFLV